MREERYHTAIDKELANYESKLKEVDLNKARLE